MSSGRLETFTAFWPLYLGEHSLPSTRWMHFVGSWVALLSVVTALVTRTPWYLVGALVSGYGFAWVSHFFMERNRPATFTYPLWSFVADWKMWALMMTGRLNDELARHGVTPRLRAGQPT
ncbi:MAG: DUF962 domain-containing protein [Myxococcaceae bacterium]|jgi:hypothetical protein|nr:DUF962 domain-containing protein [Myxococcaceae bacterium]